MSTRVAPNRYNDFFYDPLFIVSGKTDRSKQARLAAIRGAKYALCPIFSNMFTDAPHLPRFQIVLRETRAVQDYKMKKSASLADKRVGRKSDVDISGVDRFRYFHPPVATFKPNIPRIEILHTHSTIWTQSEKKSVNKKIQTKYRESSAQTSPWQPNYKVTDGGDPEILKLDFLKWGSGLPVGMHEINLIERQRMKQQWEKFLPPITDQKSLEKRRDVVEAMERDAWLHREQEIQDIQDLRFELLEKMLTELFENTKNRSEKKMQMFCTQKLAEKEEKLYKLRRDSEREKRRLDFNHRGIIMKYHPVNIIDEHADHKSELYAPMMRHGSHPKRWHQVIDEHMKKYKAKFIGVEKYDTMPKWVGAATKLEEESIKLPGTRLCIRETKWTKQVLRDLHQELKSLRKVTKRKCTLRVRVERKQTPPTTPEVEEVDEEDEKCQQGCIMVQSVIRGRSAQMVIFEGRDTCRELIQELRSTHAVLDHQAAEIFRQKLEVQYDQRDEAVCMENTKKVQEALNRLQGSVVGTLLDFLNKELRRLLDERKAHALGWRAERERQQREAAEAGRRQKELRRRKEHDEMFRQVVKIHQETVDLYLEDIITEGLDAAAASETKEYIERLAAKLDDEIYDTERSNSLEINEQEDLVAELIHHFVLPEVAKEMVRDRIRKRQNRHLKIVHNELFGTIETLPKPLGILKKKRKNKKVECEIDIAYPGFAANELLNYTPEELQSLNKQDATTETETAAETSEHITNLLDSLF